MKARRLSQVKMTARDFDESITFQSYSEVSDGAGGVTKTWANLASTPTVWAHVKANGGNEQFDSERTNASTMTTFVIRNRSDVNETMRIVWYGENYNIRQVQREGQRAMYLNIMAERGVSNG